MARHVNRSAWFGTAMAAVTALMMAGGCDDNALDRDRIGSDRNETPHVTIDDLPKQWSWPDDTDIAVLERAIEEARRTASDARQRWESAHDRQRDHWAVKWRAPTETGDVEHVWVRPHVWTQHRIEGVLANEPTQPLLGRPEPGEPVSFPTDELVDWLYAPDRLDADSREGGYTIDALLQLRDNS